MTELYPIRTCAASITAVIYDWVLNFFFFKREGEGERERKGVADLQGL